MDEGQGKQHEQRERKITKKSKNKINDQILRSDTIDIRKERKSRNNRKINEIKK